MAMAAAVGDGQVVSREEERRVIFASSLGTVFEWYDFYLYATLAPFFAALFFPPGNETAALLSAFAAYAAGFLVRPFGARAQFETPVVKEGDAIVIYVSGELDVAACERLRDEDVERAGQLREFVEQIDDQFLQTPFAKPVQMELEESGVALIRVEDGITLLALNMEAADLQGRNSFAPITGAKQDRLFNKILVASKVHFPNSFGATHSTH